MEQQRVLRTDIVYRALTMFNPMRVLILPEEYHFVYIQTHIKIDFLVTTNLCTGKRKRSPLKHDLTTLIIGLDCIFGARYKNRGRTL